MSIKVLFIIPSLDPGGIETYLLRFLKYVKEDNRIEPYILVRCFDKGNLFHQYEELNKNIYFQPLGKFNIKYIYWYYRFFVNSDFNTVCDFNSNFAGLSMFIAKISGVKNRIAFYRQGKDHFKPTFLKKFYNLWIKKLVYTFSTQILSNSKSSLNYFFSEWESDMRFRVIYNGIDINDFKFENKKNKLRKVLNIPEDAFLICHSGRLDKAKNHLTILKVAKQLIDDNKNIFFVLCGLSTEQLQEKVNILGIAENVRLLGYRRDVPQILHESDLFYFPSLTEGQPNALIEAMLSGLPFIASNINSIKEIVPDYLLPYLVDPLEVEETVMIIKDLIQNRGKINTDRMECWARENFSKDLRFKEFLNCLIY